MREQGEHEQGEAHALDGEYAGDSTQWQDLRRLDADRTPPFPTEALGPELSAFVMSVAESAQVAPDLPAMLALAAIAACVSGKVRVRPKVDYEEPLALFVVVALQPGERKSAVLAEMIAPIAQAEREQVERARQEREATQREISDLEQRLAWKRSRRRSAKTLTLHVPTLETDIEEITRRLRDAREKVVPLPRLLADDVSPGGLAGLMAEQHGRAFVASAEGGLLEAVAGRYSKGGEVNLDVFLKGHSGESLRIDRRSREPIMVRRASLTLALTVQPEVLRAASATSKLHTRGFLARILYAIPVSRVGSRHLDAPPIAAALRADYATRLRTLLALPVPAEGQAPPAIRLDDEAFELLRRLFVNHERRLHPTQGDLGDLPYWGAKYVGAIVRVAGVIHCWSHATSGSPPPCSRPIAADTMSRAIRVGEYLLAHARFVFGTMSSGAVERMTRRQAESVRDWALGHPGEAISRRDLQRLPPRPTGKNAALVVAELVARNYLRPLPPLPPAGGRSPGPRYEVHPELSGQRDERG